MDISSRTISVEMDAKDVVMLLLSWQGVRLAHHVLRVRRNPSLRNWTTWVSVPLLFFLINLGAIFLPPACIIVLIIWPLHHVALSRVPCLTDFPPQWGGESHIRGCWPLVQKQGMERGIERPVQFCSHYTPCYWITKTCRDSKKKDPYSLRRVVTCISFTPKGKV